MLCKPMHAPMSRTRKHAGRFAVAVKNRGSRKALAAHGTVLFAHRSGEAAARRLVRAMKKYLRVTSIKKCATRHLSRRSRGNSKTMKCFFLKNFPGMSQKQKRPRMLSLLWVRYRIL